MAENAKFIIETVANLSGIKQATKAMEMAEAQSRRFAQTLNATSRFMGSTVTTAYNKTGDAFEKTTSTFVQGGKTIKVVTGQIGNQAGLISESITGVGKSAKGAIPFVADFQRALARVLVVVPTWFIFRSIFVGVIRLIKSSFAFLKNWEYQMAQIGIVVNKSASELKGLSAELVTLSRNLGISNKAIGEGAKLYAQQGRAIEEILPLMDATAKLSLLTGRSITQSVEDLTAVLKAYNIEAKDAITIVDGITNVMLNNAITAGDLAQAYKQVASTASTFGVSLNALTGYITAVKTVTRDSGSKIGLTFRTLFTRLTTVSAKAIQDLTQIPLFLDETGKATSTVTPNLRNLETVISELASKFDQLGSAQQSQLAKLLGGVRRTNQVIALFKNFDQATKASIESLFNFGKGGTAVGILADTLELRVKRLTGTWQEFVDAIGDTGAIKGFLSGLTEVIRGLTLLANPRQFQRITLLEELNKQQEEFARKLNLAEGFLKAEQRAKALNESLKSGRITSAEVEAEIALWTASISRASRELGINFNSNLITAEGLAGEIARNMEDLTIAVQEIRIKEATNEIKKDLVNLASDLREVGKPLENGVTRAVIGAQVELNKLKKSQEEASSVFEKNKIGKEIEKATEKLKEFRKSQKYLKDLFRTDKTNIEKAFNLGEARKAISIFTNIGLAGTEAGQQTVLEFLKVSKQFNDTGKQITDLEKKFEGFGEKFRKQREELEKQRIVASETEATLLDKLFNIELRSIRANTDSLEITREKLKLLKENENVDSDRLTQLRENLEKEEARLKVERERFQIELRSKAGLNRAKALGASELQLAIQEFALAEATIAKFEERLKLQEKIVTLMKDEELGAQKLILDAIEAMRKASGEDTSATLLRTRAIEERLGLERQGLDALKQQLDIAKAIAEEGGDVRDFRGLTGTQIPELVKVLKDTSLGDGATARALENIADEFTRTSKRMDYKAFEASLKGLPMEERLKAREARSKGERLTPTRLVEEISQGLEDSTQKGTYEGAKAGIIDGMRAGVTAGALAGDTRTNANVLEEAVKKGTKEGITEANKPTKFITPSKDYFDQAIKDKGILSFEFKPLGEQMADLSEEVNKASITLSEFSKKSREIETERTKGFRDFNDVLAKAQGIISRSASFEDITQKRFEEAEAKAPSLLPTQLYQPTQPLQVTVGGSTFNFTGVVTKADIDNFINQYKDDLSPNQIKQIQDLIPSEIEKQNSPSNRAMKNQIENY